MESETWQSQLVENVGVPPDLTAMAYWCEQRGMHVRLVEDGERVTALASIATAAEPRTVTSSPAPTPEAALADLILHHAD
jgi:hypothetical protein